MTVQKSSHSILFLGKADDVHTARAVAFCRRNFVNVIAHLGNWGDPWPERLNEWAGDYIISYLSRWIVPPSLLRAAKRAAINFHPAPPEYPGIGCVNFALYDGAKRYGVTCHHMAPQVDTGAIIAVRRFAVLPSDDVATLLQRTYDHQLVLFYEIVERLLAGSQLPRCDEQWARRPYTRKEFESLRQITPDMSHDEIARRVRATRFGEWVPWVEIAGHVFQWKEDRGS